MDLLKQERPDIVVHLAAQAAGVRYSIENPRQYLESNINGTFELLEAARAYPPRHMLLASTSSAYGASEKCPTKKPVRRTISCHFMLPQRNQQKICHTVILTYLTYQLQCFVFLRYMAPRADL